MQINKLRTLDQFDDYLESLSNEDFFELEGISYPNTYLKLEIEGLKYLCFKRYKKFTLGSLKKEMFVNEIEEPYLIVGNEQYYGCEMDKYQESEKKVIFKDVVIKNFMPDYYRVEINNLRIMLYNEKKQMWLGNTTLMQLANETNGQLKLKNVEL